MAPTTLLPAYSASTSTTAAAILVQMSDRDHEVRGVMEALADSSSPQAGYERQEG